MIERQRWCKSGWMLLMQPENRVKTAFSPLPGFVFFAARQMGPSVKQTLLIEEMGAREVTWFVGSPVFSSNHRNLTVWSSQRSTSTAACRVVWCGVVWCGVVSCGVVCRVLKEGPDTACCVVPYVVC